MGKICVIMILIMGIMGIAIAQNRHHEGKNMNLVMNKNCQHQDEWVVGCKDRKHHKHECYKDKAEGYHECYKDKAEGYKDRSGHHDRKHHDGRAEGQGYHWRHDNCHK